MVDGSTCAATDVENSLAGLGPDIALQEDALTSRGADKRLQNLKCCRYIEDVLDGFYRHGRPSPSSLLRCLRQLPSRSKESVKATLIRVSYEFDFPGSGATVLSGQALKLVPNQLDSVASI